MYIYKYVLEYKKITYDMSSMWQVYIHYIIIDPPRSLVRA